MPLRRRLASRQNKNRDIKKAPTRPNISSRNHPRNTSKHDHGKSDSVTASRSGNGRSASPAITRDDDQCVVCAFDFGATYTSMAYTPAPRGAFERRELVPFASNEIAMVSGYAGALRSDDPEVPSILNYDVSEKESGPVRWGYRVENDRTVKDCPSSWKKIVFPKLLLSSRAESAKFMQSAKDVGDSIERSGVEIVADFLRVLVTQLNSDLSARFPSHMNVERFYFCGFPPAWPPGDIERLTTACNKAGLTNIRLVSEPTAAATALLGNMSKQRLLSYGLRKGETFLLVDAGGMTVETAVLKIIEESPVAVEQLTTGDGDYCGSGFCNLRFRNWVIEHERLNGLELEDREAIADHVMNADFETDLKRNLKPDEPDQRYRIKLPPYLFPSLERWLANANDPASHVQGYKNEPHIILSRQEIIRNFMEESFQAITELALREIKEARALGYQTVKVMLTGGFGRNTLLQQRIREALGKHDKNVQVIQPSLQTGAVSQGILSMAFNHSAVKISKLRYSIGIDEKQDYFGVLHKNAKVFYEDSKQGVVESINWILKKGAVITFNKPTYFPRQVSLDVNDDWVLDTEIITSTVTSEEHLDRLSDAMQPGKKPDEILHDIRPDCWRETILKLDLKHLSKDQKRAYLGGAPGHGRKGLLEFDVELIVRLDRLEFTFVHQKPPYTRWKLRSFHPNKVDAFRQDELAFPQPSNQTQQEHSRRTSATAMASRNEERSTGSSLLQPRNKINTLTTVPSSSHHLSSPPESPRLSSQTYDQSTPSKQITSTKRAGQPLLFVSLAKRPCSNRDTPPANQATSRSPTLQTSIEDEHPRSKLLTTPPTKNPMTPPSENPRPSDPAPAKRSVQKAFCTGRGRPRRQAEARARVEARLLANRHTPVKKTNHVPPPSLRGRSSSTSLSSVDEQFLGEWSVTRPQRDKAYRGSYRIRDLHEVEGDDQSPEGDLSPAGELSAG